MANEVYGDQSVNLFLLQTELQCLAYQSIQKHLEPNSRNALFTTVKSVYNHLVSSEASVTLISKVSHGWIGRLLTLRRNLKRIKQAIGFPAPPNIYYHVSRIDSLFSNLVIAYLQFHFPNSEVKVRLIPDGAINIFSTQISSHKIEKLKYWDRDISFRLFSDLSVTPFSGDELGANAPFVDRIYSFKGVNTHYPQEKICNIKFPELLNNSIEHPGDIKRINRASDTDFKRAVVIGQNFLQLGTASTDYVSDVSRAIENVLNGLGITSIDYVPHPRSAKKEFWCDHFNWVECDVLCVEQLIAGGEYTHVISCYSSGLLNSKLIMGDDIRAISVGIDMFPFRNEQQRLKLRQAYLTSGIELVDIQKGVSIKNMRLEGLKPSHS